MTGDRHPAHGRLGLLAGDWTFRAVAGGREVARGRSSGEWIEDGAFLVLRTDGEPAEDAPQAWFDNAPFPTTTIIALDDHSESFTYNYSDARGVSRVYAMRLTDAHWDVEGQSGPEFHQRFGATISAHGDIIAGRWESSPDGERWETDFDLVFTRERPSP